MQWRDRLVGALREMKSGDLAEEALHEVCQINGSLGYKNVSAEVIYVRQVHIYQLHLDV